MDVETEEVDVTVGEEEVFSVELRAAVNVAEEEGLGVVDTFPVELDADSVGVLAVLLAIDKVDEDRVLVVGSDVVETVVELPEDCCEVVMELVCEVPAVLFVAVLREDVREMVSEVVLLAETVAKLVFGEIKLELWTKTASLDVVTLELGADVVVGDAIIPEDEDAVARLLVDVESAADVVLVLISVSFEAVVCAASSAGSGFLVASTRFAQSLA